MLLLSVNSAVTVWRS